MIKLPPKSTTVNQRTKIKAPVLEEAEQVQKQRAEKGYKQACKNYAYYKLAQIYTVGHLKETSVLLGSDPEIKIGEVVFEFDSDEGFCKAAIQFYDESYLGKRLGMDTWRDRTHLQTIFGHGFPFYA